MLMGMSSTRAVIYLRISRDPKADGLANDRQREDCEKIAAFNGWDVVRVYEDTASASQRTVSRMGYERMRRDFGAGAFDILICWDLDRLTRQPRQLEDWIEAAEDGGLRIVTANGEADLSTDGGRMFARIKASVARQEIERKGARSRRKNDQMVASGHPAPGRRKWGWESDGITVREVEAAPLREAAQRVLEGESFRSIIREFEAAGYPPPHGGKWTHTGLRVLLKRERMAGLLIHRGALQPHSVIQPILELETWQEVRAFLADPDRRTAKGRETTNWLSSVLRCPCGSGLGGKNVHTPTAPPKPTYVCRETQRAGYHGKHVTIVKTIAEQSGTAALYFALAKLEADQGGSGEVAESRREVQAIDEQIARAEEAYAVTGSQSSLSMLARLKAERDEASRRLGVAVGSLGSRRVIEAVRSAAPAGEPLNMDSLAAFTRSFASLPADRKHSLARMAMRGHVRSGGGKGAKRITWTTPEGEPLFTE